MMSLASLLRDPNAAPSPRPNQTADSKENKRFGRRGLKSLVPSDRGLLGLRRDQAKNKRDQKDRVRNKARIGLMEEEEEDLDDTIEQEDRKAKEEEETNKANSKVQGPKTEEQERQERLARLKEFQAARLKQKAAEKRTAKPAFRLGTYKLDPSLPHDKFAMEAKGRSDQKKIVNRELAFMQRHPKPVGKAKVAKKPVPVKRLFQPKAAEAITSRPRQPLTRPTAAFQAKTVAKKPSPAKKAAPARPKKAAKRPSPVKRNAARSRKRSAQKASTPVKQQQPEEPTVEQITPEKTQPEEPTVEQITPEKTQPEPAPEHLSPLLFDDEPAPVEESARKKPRKSVRIAPTVEIQEEEEVEQENEPKGEKEKRKSRRSVRVANLLMEPEEEEEDNSEEEVQATSRPLPFAKDTPAKKLRRSSRLVVTEVSHNYGSSCGRSSARRKRRQSRVKKPSTPFPKAALDDDDEEDLEVATTLTPFMSAMDVGRSASPPLPDAAPGTPLAPFRPSAEDVPKEGFNFAETNKAPFQFSATPTATVDEEGFKTPGAGMSARASRLRKRSSIIPETIMRTPRSSILLLPRGSSSSRRRREKGLNPFDGFLPDLDLDGLPDSAASPLHGIIKKNVLAGKEGPLEGVASTSASRRTSVATSNKKKRVSIATGILVDFSTNDDGEEDEEASPAERTPRKLVFDDINEEEDEGTTDMTTAAPEEEKTAATFRRMHAAETARMSTVCDEWDRELAALEAAGELSEEMLGQIRTTIGQGRLLMNKKGRFEQFRGLVDNCEYGIGEKPTTVMDLQGFWDMVYFQVQDVDKQFEELTELKSNDWKVVPSAITLTKPTPPRKVKKPASKVTKAKNKTPAKASSSLRELMLAKRREMKENKTASEPKPATPVASKSPLLPVNKDTERVFEGGFFSVRSPLRKVTPKSATKGGVAPMEEGVTTTDAAEKLVME